MMENFLNGIYKNLGLWLVILLVLIFFVSSVQPAKDPQEDIQYSQFLQELDQGAVKSVTLQGNRIKGIYVDGARHFKNPCPS